LGCRAADSDPLKTLVSCCGGQNARSCLDDEDDAMQKLSEYVQVAEAASILGVSHNTLRTWAEDGRIPMHRNPANGYRLFRRSDLEKFLRETAKPVKEKKAK